MSQPTDRACHARRRHRPCGRSAAILLAVTALCVSLLAPVVGVPASASPPSTDGPTAAGYAAGWLAARVTAEGFAPDPLGDPSPGDTLMTALALAAAGVDQPTFDRTVAWLADHVDAVTGTGSTTSPGQIGYLLVVVGAADADPTSFGGVDLVARLAGTLGAFEPGLYGAGDPTFDGAFRQGVAIIGLVAAGEPVPSEATNWLSAQQCGTSDPAIRGGWEAYRSLADACTAGSTVTFTGVDSNSTAMAASALAAVGVEPAFSPLAWFDAVQNPTGGWGFLQGLDDDPNSDALVIQAITALGASATEAPFVEDGGDPLSTLLGFQLGCDAAPADQGAFTFPGSDGAPNVLATEQAIWGAVPRTFPVGEVSFVAAPVPCQAPPTSAPTTSTTPTSASTPTTTGTARAPDPVETTPAVTG
ncbi:MAG: hypothetical protein ACXV95_05085 [Acidimicrobiales bacterium]